MSIKHLALNKYSVNEGGDGGHGHGHGHGHGRGGLLSTNLILHIKFQMTFGCL